MIEKSVELDAVKVVDEAKSTLSQLGMLRPGDDQRATELREWFADRRAGIARSWSTTEPLPVPAVVPRLS